MVFFGQIMKTSSFTALNAKALGNMNGRKKDHRADRVNQLSATNAESAVKFIQQLHR